MKILLLSNSPTAGTGYGVQAAMLADRLAGIGHDVAISCNFGHQVGVKGFKTESGHTVRLYPSRFSAAGDDIVHGHANHFFEGDKHGGWIITITDVWAINNPALAEFKVAAWAPVDHLTMPPGVGEFFRLTHASPLAMSRHAEAEFARLGMNPTYIPLAVDTKAYVPTFEITDKASGATVDSRTYFDLPHSAFVVGMVAMNKGWVLDRKGFSEAFYAFGEFRRRHPEAVLFCHTDKIGADGISLTELAFDAGIPADALIFSNQYAYTLGFSTEMMAAAYSAMDVLLCPSHGEGFGVPMIEAQACGTPVIASNATAQSELVGPGWLVDGQRTWNQSQRAPSFVPSVIDIVDKLELAFVADLAGMQDACRSFAAGYDADKVFAEHWVPFLEQMEPPARELHPPMTDVAVLVPVMNRPHNVKRVVDSFNASNDGTAKLFFVVDPDDAAEIAAIKKAKAKFIVSDRGRTYAAKANVGYAKTTESFVFVCGDDCEFTPGWLDAPRLLSDRYHLIGTNDSEKGRVRNTEVAAGRHADHFFLRRSYIDEPGSCLEGPGVLAPEAYTHFYTDKEIVALARARGVFTACLDSRVIHHHPGFDGDEQARKDDATYMKAVEHSESDRVTFVRRLPLIEQQRNGRGA